MKKWLLLAPFLLASTALRAEPAAVYPATAIFAGGCFWSMEHAFDDAPGVVNAVSGYTGGTVPNPSYEQVSAGDTGHVEAVEVTYDPAKTTYARLLDIYWHHVDPFDAEGQFCDKGPEYRSEIFVHGDAQKKEAENSKAAIEKVLGKSVVTQIRVATPFYAAEEYHQQYTRKNPVRYQLYKTGCGRDKRIAEIWENAK